MKYSEKLRDPRWQKKRLEIMNRDEFTCQACSDSKSTLNVHHMQYHGDPWDAPNESLETLCELCHEQRTAFNKEIMSMPSGVVLSFQDHFLRRRCSDMAMFHMIFNSIRAMAEDPLCMDKKMADIVSLITSEVERRKK